MNKKIKFTVILLVIFAATFLNGCITKTSEKSTQQEAEVTADSLLDNQLYTEASEQNSLEKCKLISDEAKAEECEKVVNANLISIKAVKERNSKLCKSINLERYKEACNLRVKEQIAQDEEQKREQQRVNEMTQKSQEIHDSGDVTRCKELEDKNFQEVCELNILVNKALEENNKASCNEASTKELQKRCVDNFIGVTKGFVK